MLGSPRMSSALTSRRIPTPWHSGQAPKGELKENWRGSSSGKDSPQVGQASFSEKTTVSAAAVRPPDRAAASERRGA